MARSLEKVHHTCLWVGRWSLAEGMVPPAISHQLCTLLRFLPPSIRPPQGRLGSRETGPRALPPTRGSAQGFGTLECWRHSRNTDRYLENVLNAPVN